MATKPRSESIPLSPSDGGGEPLSRTVQVGGLVRTPKTSEVVAGRIRKMILRGELKDGDYLPPERLLMTQLGTSRPTLREAFRILESENFISLVRGSRTGARIHLPEIENVARQAGFALQGQGATLTDIYEARLALEPYAARLASLRRTPEDLGRLRGRLDEIRDLARKEEWSEFRRLVPSMHQLVVDASHNKTLSMVLAMLQEVLEKHQSRFREGVTDEQVKNVSLAMRSFERAIDLIEAGNADEAEAHWRRHTENANKIWLVDADDKTLIDVLD